MTQLNVGKCSKCDVQIVVLDTVRGSVLPVESVEGIIYDEAEIYNKTRHKSHLLNCKALALEWELIAARIVKRRNAKLKLEQKDLLR